LGQTSGTETSGMGLTNQELDSKKVESRNLALSDINMRAADINARKALGLCHSLVEENEKKSREISELKARLDAASCLLSEHAKILKAMTLKDNGLESAPASFRPSRTDVSSIASKEVPKLSSKMPLVRKREDIRKSVPKR
jgi:hypothetical protein